MTRFPFSIIVTIIAIAIFMSFFRLGSVSFFDVDEAVFAEATKEMFQSGNWITPTYNGENRYDKPIFFYWLMAASYKLFGINEFAARFPSAMASLLLALSVFFFVRYFLDSKNALYATISLVLSVYFLVYSHAAVTDITLTLFITLSICSFYLSVTGIPYSSLRKGGSWYIYGFYIFSALAFLTKGLIGILFPFGIAIIYLLVTEGLTGIKKAFSLKGAILFLIVAAPWYIAQIAINGQEFIQHLFIKHHFKRYTGVISGHKNPIYYFIPMLIIGLFPWIAFLPAGIRNLFLEVQSLRLRPEGFGELSRTAQPEGFKVQSKTNSLLKAQNSKVLLLAFIWLAFIFVFFSFSTTKLPNYILPAIPAASILISSGMSIKERRSPYLVFGFLFIVIISFILGLLFVISKKYLSKIGIHDVNWTFALATVMFAMAIASLYALLIKKTLYEYMSALMIVFLVIISIKALPAANQYLQGTLYKYSLYAKERLHNGEIITYGINNPSIVFYSGHKIINVRNRDGLLPFIKNNRNLIAISKTKDIDVLKDLGFNLLENDGRYAILEKK
ncbi:MAG: glycosyltransferase family 39 protein [Nitrospirota bacterium]